MNLDHKEWVLIQRYITGNAETDECRKINDWMGQDPENRKLVRELEEIWNLTPAESFNVDVQQAWEKFRNKNHVNIHENSKSIGYESRKDSRSSLYMLRVAAVILVALLSGLFAQNHLKTIEGDAFRQAGTFNVLQELDTEKGEKARVTFSDGTRVTLNSASSVKFPQEFHGAKREVFLDGEAYFEVAHNPDKPFIVHSQDARIEVLGTEFNVRGWSEDPTLEVIVRGGTVSVESTTLQPNERSEVILTEGLKTEIQRGRNPFEPVRVDPIKHLLWTSGGIHFDNEPFRGVVRSLERRFNVNITVGDETLLDVPYTGTFQYAELNEMLLVIAATMDVGFSRDGAKVEFYP